MILLSPANSLESLEAAFSCGADAAYVGVGGWGLRPTLFELRPEELTAAVSLAHGRGRKLFVCMNIRPAPAEMHAFLADAERFALAGVDAVVLADPGAMDALKQQLPDLPLHASVQCSVVNAEGALFYHDLGCAVVVLSRSITDPVELAQIVKAVGPGTAVEAFVHGDVCHNLDGICYLTGYMHREPSDVPRRSETPYVGNSNRGECSLVCKQACELHSAASNIVRGNLLRRPDLMTLNLLPALVQAGVSILKIEGRQFPVEYVRAVTAIYRRALDFCLADPSAYSVDPSWESQAMAFLSSRDTSYAYQRAAWQARPPKQ